MGRVFLVGDAAHVHSPAGAQGMNTGMHDAANLSWKLAAAVQGWAPDGLLDSYHSERHPVGRMVMRSSGAVTRLVMVTACRMQRGWWPALRLGAIARRVAGSVSGVGIHYPRSKGTHALAGTRAEDMHLADDGRCSTRLYEMLRKGNFVLLVRAGLTPAGVTPANLRAAAPWATRVQVANPAAPQHPIMLVRPDGYIAWATDTSDAQRLDEQIQAALSQWCGTVTGYSAETTPSAV